MACYTGILQQRPLTAVVSLVQLTGEIREREPLQGTVRLSSYLTGVLSERSLYGRMMRKDLLSGEINRRALTGTLRDITGQRLRGTLTLSPRLRGSCTSQRLRGTMVQHFMSGKITPPRAITGVMLQRELFPWFSVVCPVDLVSSCFGGGFWIEDYPWIESDAFLENP